MAKILVIDDNDALRKLVARMLQDEGHDVATAANGKQGLVLYLERLPDLVITDVLMPDMDGVETVAALRKIAPGTKVIMMSGGGEAASGREYLSAMDSVLGVPHVIAKPFEKAALVSMVKKALAS